MSAKQILFHQDTHDLTLLTRCVGRPTGSASLCQ
jgi:hypothetical protein